MMEGVGGENKENPLKEVETKKFIGSTYLHF